MEEIVISLLKKRERITLSVWKSIPNTWTPTTLLVGSFHLQKNNKETKLKKCEFSIIYGNYINQHKKEKRKNPDKLLFLLTFP